MGLVFDIRRYSIHDGPGIRTTVFLKGCPLSCWWCHNPEGQASAIELVFRENRCVRCGACVEACRQGAISWQVGTLTTDREKCLVCGTCVAVCYAEARELTGREMTVNEVVAEIERDAAFYEESGGGVTFSGGEPLAQVEFLLGLLRACKEKRIHATVDTCGLAEWESFEKIRDYVDLFMYDLKLMDDVRHRRFTGVSNELILRNLRALSERGHEIVLRLPVIPGISDDAENVRRTGIFAAALPHLSGVDVLPYHHIAADKYGRLNRVYRLPGTRPPSDAKVAEMVDTLRNLGLAVRT